MARVFVSYCRADDEIATEIKTELGKIGYDVWVDTKNVRAGTEWRGVIDDEIRRSIAVIVVMTAAAKSSEYVTYEWSFAYGAGVRVIPLLFIPPDSLHPRLMASQYRDFRTNKSWIDLVSDLRDAEKSAKRLIIHRAVWSSEPRTIDVTDIIKENIQNGKVKMLAKTRVLGEPENGQYKVLNVFYSASNRPGHMWVREHGELSIDTWTD